MVKQDLNNGQTFLLLDGLDEFRTTLIGLITESGVSPGTTTFLC